MLIETFCPECLEYTQGSRVENVKTYEIKGETLEVTVSLLQCRTCENLIPTRELDKENFDRAYGEYRKFRGFLQPAEIIALREKYGLSQRQYAKLLGWSPATLCRYETGAIQSQSHNNELVLLQDPANLWTLLERNRSNFSSKELASIRGKIESVMSTAKEGVIDRALEKLIFKAPSIYTGFKRPNLDRLIQTVKFFASRDTSLYKVKLMKYLWYSDFLHFKRSTISINGLQYAHLPMGPVPDQYEIMLSLVLQHKEHVGVQFKYFPDGGIGELFVAEGEADESIFTEEEVATLDTVYKKLCLLNARRASDLSHDETAWKETKDEELISYEYAFNLSID